MLTFDDIKNMKRGKEAEVQEQSSQIAARKLEEIANVENQQTQEMDQGNLQSDAQKIITEIQNNPELDPEEVISSLPPILQQAVFEQMGSIPQEEQIDENIEEPIEGEFTEPEEEPSQRKL